MKTKFIALNIIIALINIMYYQAGAQSTFSSERLSTAAYEHLKIVYGDIAELKFLQNIPDVSFKENGISGRCSLNRQAQKNLTSIVFEFFDKEKMIKSLKIPVRISILIEAPIANTFLKGGKNLTKEDFSLQKMEIFADKDLKIPDINNLEGCLLKKSVRKGEMITNEDIADELIVKRGDKIIVQVQSGAVRVRASAYAMQDGRVGESIKLKFNNNILQGYIAQDGTILLTKNNNIN